MSWFELVAEINAGAPPERTASGPGVARTRSLNDSIVRRPLPLTVVKIHAEQPLARGQRGKHFAFALFIRSRGPIFNALMTVERSHPSRSSLPPKVGLARALSKLGYCSRSQGWELIQNARVQINGRVCVNPEQRVDLDRDRITVDGKPLALAQRVYVMLNKPRGLVTTRSDERGRDTIYRCFEGSGLPWLSPVGRLDQASEGLLLLTNDTDWANHITSPQNHVDKAYHVQIDCHPSDDFLQNLVLGVGTASSELHRAKHAQILRIGTRNSWLEIKLDEGKNRQIRRLIEASGAHVLRLVRVAIGSLKLGPLGKGHFRHLTDSEIAALAP